MNCQHIQQLIDERLDRPLLPAEAEQLRAHVARCPECARYSRALQTGLAGLQALPAMPASPQVRESVLAYVERGRYGPARPRNAVEWFSNGAKIAGAVTAFAIVAFVLAAIFNGIGGDDGSGQLGAGQDGPTPGGSVAGFGEIKQTPTPELTPDVALPPCQPGQVELALDASLVISYGNMPDFVSITVTALKSTGGIVCQFTAPISVAVNDADGYPVDAIGNPGRWLMDTALPGEQASVSFAWTNWCGDTDGFTASANTDTGNLDADISVSLPDISAPSCSLSEGPSTLGALTPLEVAESLPPCEEQQGATFTHYWEERDGSLRLWVGATSMAACEPAGDVTIALLAADGEPLPIDGNPLTTREATGVGAVRYAGIAWLNWCGASEELQLDIARPGMGAGSNILHVPECEQPGEPSRLEDITVEILPQPASSTTVGPPPPSDLPACDPAAVTLNEPALELINEAMSVSISVAAQPEAACALSTTLTVTLTDSAGTPLDVAGNELVMHMDGDVARLLAGFHFVWENWCGEAGAYSVTFTLGEHATQASSALRPACLDPQQPSTLRSEPTG